MVYLCRFVKALGLTLALEVPLLLLLLSAGPLKRKDSSLRAGTILAAGITASCATLPYVWFVFIELTRNRYLYLGLAEGFAVMAEAILYIIFLKSGLVRGFFLSLLCNALSFAAGLLLGPFIY